jgi:hypothetical protein
LGVDVTVTSGARLRGLRAVDQLFDFEAFVAG